MRLIRITHVAIAIMIMIMIMIIFNLKSDVSFLIQVVIWPRFEGAAI
jgi:hypothetical protein